MSQSKPRFTIRATASAAPPNSAIWTDLETLLARLIAKSIWAERQDETPKSTKCRLELVSSARLNGQATGRGSGAVNSTYGRD
jgi:hypothetical protein